MYKLFDRSGFMIVYNSSLCMELHGDTEAVPPAKLQNFARARPGGLCFYRIHYILSFYGS
jgi:hypothetical protein